MRVASAQSTGSRASQQSPLLSLDDVYKLAERTRMRTTLEARHLLYCQPQKLIRLDSAALSRPETGVTSSVASQEEDGPREKEQQTDPKEQEGEEERVRVAPAPGFVSNVKISIKPRPAPVNSCSSFIATYSNNDRSRIGLSRSHTFITASLPAVSPRSPIVETETRSSPCDCPDISGPGLCLQCRTLATHTALSDRMALTFPPRTISGLHVTSSALVRRMLPKMTQAEIQDKLARGEIAKSALIFPRRYRDKRIDDVISDDDDDVTNTAHRTGPENWNEVQEEEQTEDAGFVSNRSQDLSSSADPDPASPHTDRTGSSRTDSRVSARYTSSISLLASLKLRLRGEATTPLYFMDLKHMNSKIYHGRMGSGLVLAGRKEGVKGMWKKKSLGSDAKPLWPAFVSPRKVKLVEEPSYRAYYAPPLLAKRKQVSNPAFFAGSKAAYSLPERLPDVLEFAGGKMSITDPNSLISQNSMPLSVSPAPSPSPDAAVSSANVDATDAAIDGI